MFLTRNACSDLPLAYGDPGTPKGSQVFGTGDLDFGFGWGPAVGATYRLNACNRFGVEFYAIDSWSSTDQVMGNYSVQFPSLPYLPELGTPGDPTSGDGVATFHYGSRLYNTELNFYHHSRNADWLTMLAGFRWVELGEDFSTVFDTGDTSPRYAINVYNHLYGMQLGMLTELPNPSAWELDGWLKAGLYGNRANQDTTEDFTSAGGVVTHGAARDSNAAFVGDLGITAKRAITDQLSFSVSYMALWIEGIALAPEQLDNSDPSSAIVSLDNGGGTFYHGGFVGGEYRW
ncbi:MAG: BBP7 family outer membrane beta-barrel protein [Planctomycetota bacterium]